MAADHLEPAPRRSDTRSAFIPLLILVGTYVTASVFQTNQLLNERDMLRNVHANQEKQLQDSRKLRESLDRLSRETQLLANRGNRSATVIVEELRRRGITINPDAPGIPAPTASSDAPPAATK